MKKQKIFICISLALVLFMVTLGNSTAYAASIKRIPDKSTRIHVGSTVVGLEVGCKDDNFAYATVSADKDVDVNIKMIVHYDNNRQHVTVKGGFDQRTYGGVDYYCSSKISLIECYFTISSIDGVEKEFPLDVQNP